MFHYHDVVTDLSGNSLQGASVYIYLQGTTTPASLYSDDFGVTSKSNPIVTGSTGRFDFYIVDGNYDIHIVRADATTTDFLDVAMLEGGGSGGALAVTDYGATPDAKSITTGSTTASSTTLTAPASTFVSADTGKTVIVRNQSTKVVVFKGTMTFVSGTQATLSGTSSETLTGNAWVVWGTDNSTAIQNALNAAATLATGPTIADFVDQNNFPLKLGVVTVEFPITSAGSMYLFGTQLTVARKVNINADAMLFSAVGTKTASDRVWAIVFSAGAWCDRLLLDACSGMGIKFGAVLTQSNSYVGDIQIWHAGGNNNGALTPPDQTAIQFLGYDFHINRIWLKGGSIGLDLSVADLRLNQAELIGANTGLRIFDGGNVPGNIQLNQVTLDSIGTTGVSVEVGAEIIGKFYMFGGTGSYGMNIGNNVSIYDVHAIDFEFIADNCPITALKVANTLDSKFRLNLSNAKFSFASATPITKVVEYGTGNSGNLNIEASIDSAIGTLFSGTRYGHLQVNFDGNVTEYLGSSGAKQQIRAVSDGANAATLELYNDTNGVFWHIPVRANASDALQFYGNNGGYNLAAWMGITGKLGTHNFNSLLIVDGVTYTTIQAAVNALPAGGGTVYVPAGSYAENITIAKSHVLLWMDDNAILASTGATALTIGDATSAYDNIRVQGGQIKPSGATPTKGIWLKAHTSNALSNITIDGVRIDGTSASGGAFDGVYGDGILSNIKVYPGTQVTNVRDGYSFQSTAIEKQNQIVIMGRANAVTRYGAYGVLLTGFHIIGAELATAADVDASRGARFEGVNGGSIVSSVLRRNVSIATANVTLELVNSGATNTSSVAVTGSYIDGLPTDTGGRVQITTSNNITFTGNTFVAQGSGSSVRITGTVTGIYNNGGNTNWSIDTNGALGDFSARRFKATGTALVAGDFALDANWGAGAAVSAVTGTDQAWSITVTAAGIPVLNAGVTLTFKDGTWTNAPICQSQVTGGTGAIADISGAPTATTWPMTYNGTVVAGLTYVLTGVCFGR